LTNKFRQASGKACTNYQIRQKGYMTFTSLSNIQYPILSDIEATTVKALGILNQQYSEGQPAYGIPYPGIYVLDTNKKIVGKVFIEGYKQRVYASSVLAYARKVLASN